MLETRMFNQEDQLKFAELTGDFNPMHIDPVAARRTQAGAPVVHGVHSLLWLLDVIARRNQGLPPIAKMKVRFARMLYVGEEAVASLSSLNERELRGAVTVGGMAAVQLTVTFGSAQAVSGIELPRVGAPLARPREPLDRSLESMAEERGLLSFATGAAGLEVLFPHAAALLAPSRMAAIACTTLLVGMVLPGLHSIYSGFVLGFCAGQDDAGLLAYNVTSIESRFRLVRIQVWGGGLFGDIETFVRHQPVTQTPIQQLGAMVAPEAFSGATALIIGGSRGIGELTAKILAAGGGEVIITYAVGKSEADRVQSEILAWGGKCKVVQCDVRNVEDDPFASFPDRPTHIYFFATPPIFGRNSSLFSVERFNDFNLFYISGFSRIVEAAHRRNPDGISVFFPSTVAVEERPANMTEYSMSKAAGEILCADLNSELRKIRTRFCRLPRLLTDQTATVQSVATPKILDIMLPIIQDLQIKISGY